MPVDRLEPLTTAQKIQEIQINSRTTTQPTEHYECPAGKKAIFNGFVQCTSIGASAETQLRDPKDGFNIVEWGATSLANGRLATGLKATITNFQLEAGDTIKTTQDTPATNAEFNVVGTILELPI